jgi:hypothetical protein
MRRLIRHDVRNVSHSLRFLSPCHKRSASHLQRSLFKRNSPAPNFSAALCSQAVYLSSLRTNSQARSVR